MTLTIELTPEQEARLQQEARVQGKPAAEIVRALIEGLPPRAQTPAERAQALFDRWAAEDATDDPEEIARRERECEEFKANMNANRAVEGRPPVYP
ncbi:MAG TPA: hypothetical protein VFB21_10155 [Chthonomonadaceae bacterium]|nr:hypothetical protein [Chthonomonadaceae bacterium]